MVEISHGLKLFTITVWSTFRVHHLLPAGWKQNHDVRMADEDHIVLKTRSRVLRLLGGKLHF